MPDQKKKHTYQSATLGLPPLTMVLVHARNEAQNAGTPPVQSLVPPPAAEDEQPLDKEQAVRRIIRHLQAGDH
jgi:hypothetical protein